MVPVLTGFAGLLLGFAAGFVYRKTNRRLELAELEARAQKLLLDAETRGRRRLEAKPSEAKDEIATMRREADDDLRDDRDEIGRQERPHGGVPGRPQEQVRALDGRAATSRSG